MHRQENVMTISAHTAFTAICHELDADYLPTFAKPLPRELEDLLAQLVAHEIRKRGSTEQSGERLQPLNA
jgi:hypothetical protein